LIQKQLTVSDPVRHLVVDHFVVLPCDSRSCRSLVVPRTRMPLGVPVLGTKGVPAQALASLRFHHPQLCTTFLQEAPVLLLWRLLLDRCIRPPASTCNGGGGARRLLLWDWNTHCGRRLVWRFCFEGRSCLWRRRWRRRRFCCHRGGGYCHWGGRRLFFRGNLAGTLGAHAAGLFVPEETAAACALDWCWRVDRI